MSSNDRFFSNKSFKKYLFKEIAKNNYDISYLNEFNISKIYSNYIITNNLKKDYALDRNINIKKNNPNNLKEEIIDEIFDDKNNCIEENCYPDNKENDYKKSQTKSKKTIENKIKKNNKLNLFKKLY